MKKKTKSLVRNKPKLKTKTKMNESQNKKKISRKRIR